MDSIIWWLHAQVARAAAEYSLTHPENTGAMNALPYLVTSTIYAWLYATLWIGLRREWLYFRGISPVREHLEQLSKDVEAATVATNGGIPAGYEQRPDGSWRCEVRSTKPPYEVTGWAPCDAPQGMRPAPAVTRPGDGRPAPSFPHV